MLLSLTSYPILSPPEELFQLPWARLHICLKINSFDYFGYINHFAFSVHCIHTYILIVRSRDCTIIETFILCWQQFPIEIFRVQSYDSKLLQIIHHISLSTIHNMFRLVHVLLSQIDHPMWNVISNPIKLNSAISFTNRVILAWGSVLQEAQIILILEMTLGYLLLKLYPVEPQLKMDGSGKLHALLNVLSQSCPS